MERERAPVGLSVAGHVLAGGAPVSRGAGVSHSGNDLAGADGSGMERERTPVGLNVAGHVLAGGAPVSRGAAVSPSVNDLAGADGSCMERERTPVGLNVAGYVLAGGAPGSRVAGVSSSGNDLAGTDGSGMGRERAPVELSVAGYVLAGGESRRMGRDKALLEENGVTLVARVADVVSSVAGNATIVAPVGRYEGLGVPVLNDSWPGEGPLGGILTALSQNKAEWNLIVAVDMPHLDSGYLQTLLTAAGQGRETVIPAHANGDMEPLCGVYHSSALHELRRFFDSGGRRVKDALQTIPLRTVPAAAGILANVNTPEQWEAAKS